MWSEILGHRSIESTQVYVHSSQRRFATRSSGWNSAPAPGPDPTKEKDDDQLSRRPQRPSWILMSRAARCWCRWSTGWSYDDGGGTLSVRCSNRVATTLCSAQLAAATVNCDQVVHHPGMGLCFRCRKLWDTSPPEISFEEFCQTAPACARPVGVQQLCLVCRTPGHERPVQARACATHGPRRRHGTETGRWPSMSPGTTGSRQPLLVRLRQVRGQRMCAMGSSGQPRPMRGARRTWVKDGRPTGPPLRSLVCSARSLDVSSRVVRSRGLSERARMEVLYGLHCAAVAERTIRVKALQAAVNRLRGAGHQGGGGAG